MRAPSLDSESSESNESSESSKSNEEESPIKQVVNRKYISNAVWKNVPEKSVKSLPPDINGTKIYVLPYDTSNPMKITASDGRRWQCYRMSNKKVSADILCVTDGDGMPKERCMQAVLNAIKTDQPASQINQIAEEYSNCQIVRDAKKEAMKEKQPHCHNIEAVKTLKTKLDSMESCLIRNVETDDTKCVVTSSELKGKIAANMHRGGTHLMAKEFFVLLTS
ncbi:hypothetical protein ACROYT_G015570 [Oculina patagonica]